MGLATLERPAAHRSSTAADHRFRLRILRTYTHWHWLIPALYALATVVLLFPLVRSVRDAVAETIGDPLLNAWTLRWVQHALVTDPARLYDGNMFAPNPRSLAFSELLLPQAILTWPVWLVFRDALLAYNLSVLITYPLCATAMYALCRALGANRGASFIAGLLYAFAPFRMDNTARLQVLSMQWMPLALLAVIRFVQRPSWWRGAAVTVTMALVALSSVYYAVMFATGFGAFLLIEAIRQRRIALSRAGIGLVAALLIAGAVVTALDAPYLTMRREQEIVRTLDEAYDDSADFGAYVTVTPGSRLWGGILPTSRSEQSALFPGALLLVLAALGLRAVRRPWIAGIVGFGIVAFVLSFGPTLGEKQTGIPLPYRFLYDRIVGYQGLRGPDRFASLVLLTLAVLAALGGTAAWRAVVTRRRSLSRFALVATALVALLGTLDVSARLLPTVPVDRSETALAPYRWLAANPQPGIVAEFPVERTDVTTSFYSTYYWGSVLWGHSGFIPSATYQLRGYFAGRYAFPRVEDLTALMDMGVRTLVIHRDQLSDKQRQTLDAQYAQATGAVRLLARAGDADLYALTPEPEAAPLTYRIDFATNPAGNLGSLAGTLTILNADAHTHMSYMVDNFDLAIVIRDARGQIVSTQKSDVRPPAIIPRGTTQVRLSVPLPRTPGAYTVSVVSDDVAALAALPPTPVRVVDYETLPRLTLTGARLTSPPLYEPDEPIAMWVTTKSGKTTALPDATARSDGTLDVTLGAIPPDAAQIVAHGKASGLELWVAPP